MICFCFVFFSRPSFLSSTDFSQTPSSLLFAELGASPVLLITSMSLWLCVPTSLLLHFGESSDFFQLVSNQLHTVPPSEAFLINSVFFTAVLQDSFSSWLAFPVFTCHIQSDQTQNMKSPHTVQSRSKKQHGPQWWKHSGLEQGCFCGLSLPTPPIQIAPVA